MDTHIERLEELESHGITIYSLIRGMNMYRAEVRASGIYIYEREDHENGGPEAEDSEELRQIEKDLIDYLVKEIEDEEDHKDE